MPAPPSRKSLAAGLIVASWFFLLSRPFEAPWFDNDSVLNIAFLHGYGRVPIGIILTHALTVFTPEYRPAGGLYYRTLFALFGLNPVPFRVTAIVLLGLNLVLAARWYHLLSDSRYTAAAATLLFSFHPALAELYYADGTIYDMLCAFFILLILGQYVRIRRENRFFTWGSLSGVAALYGAALGSKEMAITLPGVLILYEAVYHAHWRSLRRRFGPIFVLTIMTVLCMVWKTMVPNAMTSNIGGAYTPRYQSKFIAQQYLYYYKLLLFHVPLTGAMLAATLALALIVALALRNRPMLFGLLFANLVLLPLCVIPPRSGFVLYIPLLGWALYGGSAIAQFCAGLLSLAEGRGGAGGLRPHDASYRKMAICGSLVIVLFVLQEHFATNLSAPFIPPQKYLRSLLAAARGTSPALPSGSRILLESEPAEDNSLMPLFLLRLAYRDPTLWVDHIPHSEDSPRPADHGLYAMSIRWNGSGFQAVAQPQSDEQPLQIAVVPGFVHRGHALHVQFPVAFAGCIIDAAYRMPEDELTRAGFWPLWTKLDDKGGATVQVGRDAERGLIVIDRIRPCGRNWTPAEGSFSIIP